MRIFAFNMIKKFNIIANHLSNGAMQEAAGYEMGITKYARMRQERKTQEKIAIVSAGVRRAEAMEEIDLGTIMPFVKK